MFSTVLKVVTVLLACGTLEVTGKPKESFKSLENKLNLILESQSFERELIQSAIDKDSVSSSTNSVNLAAENGDNNEVINLDKVTSDPFKISTGSDRILQKLEDNAKKMDTMVMFFADMKSVLDEAVKSQMEDLELRSEVNELKEELQYLRVQLEKVKHEKTSYEEEIKANSLQNKIHNDEKTITWLKDSVHELRSEMADLSRACNVTVLMQMKQQWERDMTRKDSGIQSLQQDLDIIKLQQIQMDENIGETQENVADIRKWQYEMGQKVASFEMHSLEFMGTNEIPASYEKKAHKPRHEKKIQSQLANFKKMVKELQKDNKKLHSKVNTLEKIQDQFSLYMKSSPWSNGKTSSLEETTDVENRVEKTDSGSRLVALEKVVSDFTYSVDRVNDKVAALNQLHESTSQLFTALENLETKYDGRLDDMQTVLAKMEASVSSMDLATNELKEQKDIQQDSIHKIKKDLQDARGRLQTNQLRLASIQTHMLGLASSLGSDESAESMQNIRISLLESAVRERQKRITEEFFN